MSLLLIYPVPACTSRTQICTAVRTFIDFLFRLAVPDSEWNNIDKRLDGNKNRN